MTGGVYGRERVPLLTAAEAAALDDRARDRAGVPERALMENAGRAAALVVHRLFPDGRIVAVVGPGNNGGDALVALRSLRAWGRDVAWVPAADRVPDPGLLTGFEIPRIDGDGADAALAGAAVIVDGILGTGAKGAPREDAAALVRRMNGSGRPIVALDIPSGVDPSTGAVPGGAVRASLTVQFGWPKRGALLQPGRALCGRVLAVEIGFPPVTDDDDAPGAALITPDWARARLPARAPDAHKNSVGRVVIVAGRKGMGGAAAIAAQGAMRAGAGYVRVVSDEANRTLVQTVVPEAIFVDRADGDAVAEAVEQADVVLAGPAMDTGDDGADLLDRVLAARGGRGIVADADALTILAGRAGRDGLDGLDGLASAGPALLTPHPGEMARITGASSDDIRRDPLAAVADLAGRCGASVLLKGAPSVVAAPGRPVLVSAVGSSDLAAAAMGDQLAGMAAAFLAAGVDAATAGGLALLYGGRAAELAGRGRSLTARDVADRIHDAIRDPGPAGPPDGLPFVVFDQPARW